MADDQSDLPDDDGRRWLAEARIAEAAQARARERWLRQQAQEGATFGGVALALTEHGAPVTAGLIDGTEHHGTLTGAGEDYLSLLDEDGTTHLLALHAVGFLRSTDARSPVASDSRRPPHSGGLWEVLASAVADRPDVVIRAGGTTVSGVLEAVGEDVVTVAGPRPQPPTYVSSWSIDSVSLRSSG